MTSTCFKNILNNLTYTNKDPPEYDMLDCWNKNMAKMFLPSMMNCIDESMSKWVNEYTCSGFMFVPHKPWSFGNEYHDTGCAESDIIWAWELWEGKDCPPQLNNKPFDDIGKTVGSLLCLTEPVWGSGRVFVLDSCFCVLQVIVELWKKGFFTVALIKKHCYWPKYIPGDNIISHFAENGIGHFRECLTMSNSMLLQ